VTQVAAAPHAETPAAAPAEPAGKFHVQVAAVRTRSEAYALAVRLVSQYSSELGGRKPQVDDTVIGSMGTFYRVRLGPYASAEEPKHLCGSLRSSGFDCLVVAQ
jgi:cell division septation protein DedD